MGEVVQRKTLVKQAMTGAVGIGMGIGLMILSTIGLVGGLIAGGVLVALGLAASASRDDKVAGIALLGVGGLTLLSKLPILSGISNFLLIGGGVVLIAAGAFSLIKFFSNLKKRG